MAAPHLRTNFFHFFDGRLISPNSNQLGSNIREPHFVVSLGNSLGKLLDSPSGGS